MAGELSFELPLLELRAKIEELRKFGSEKNIDFSDEIQQFKDKVLRLADKWWAVKWEKEGRSRGYFVRTPVGD